MLMNVVYAMIFLMKVSNVQDVHFYVVQSVLIIIILLIIVIVQFVGIKKCYVLRVGALYIRYYYIKKYYLILL